MSNWFDIDQNAFISAASTGTIFPLREYCLLNLQGTDAETFLQGQLTNDVSTLDNGQSQWSAHCNPKGRMISSYLLHKVSEHHFYLRVHAELAEAAQQALDKYLIFSKAELTNHQDAHGLTLMGDKASSLFPLLKEKLIFSVIHDKQCIECWFHTSHWPDIKRIALNNTLASADTWKAWQIKNGMIDVTRASSEKYLPQELNYDARGAVSFKKGCYTGQEVIARLHYRGQAKRNLHLGRCQLDGEKLPAEIVTKEALRRSGEIVLYVVQDDGTANFLALVDHKDVTNKQCILSMKQAINIEWLSLPYAIN